MAVQRSEYPDEQWADIERRPTHGIVRRIARETARIQRGNDPLEAEDALVSNLVKAWRVTDDDGRDIPFQKSEYDKVPTDTWSRIVDDCTSVLETNIPNPQTRSF